MDHRFEGSDANEWSTYYLLIWTVPGEDLEHAWVSDDLTTLLARRQGIIETASTSRVLQVTALSSRKVKEAWEEGCFDSKDRDLNFGTRKENLGTGVRDFSPVCV